jgi:hypothetical protein
MNSWPKYPTVYEINAWVWLNDLSRAYGRALTLGDVPQTELERLAEFRFDALWLMGVWERSPGARQISRTNPGLLEEYRHILPDYTEEDVVGSPYAIRGYRVDAALGGDEGLAEFRARMLRSGLRLVLDFVPNHMAIDHGWVTEHPERLVEGDAERLEREPRNYFRVGDAAGARVFAHGRDPYFEGWPDTVQLDFRRAETRDAMTEALLSVAARCDGARCDMAMLVTREIFLRTWGGEFDAPSAEFWPEAIHTVKSAHPDFLLMAEVYWEMEYRLQQQGFDFAYDKRLYDRLLTDDATGVRAHLRADLSYQSRLARFTENHDERRAHCPDSACCTRGSWKAGARSSPCISGDARRSRRTRASKLSTDGCWRHSRKRFFTTATGNKSSRARLGTATRATSISWRAAGRLVKTCACLSLISRLNARSVICRLSCRRSLDARGF